MKSEQPANDIMKIGEWRDAVAYRIACDCHHPDHDVNLWIEINPDSEYEQFEVTFYVDTYIPWWRQGFNRFKAMWALLTKGHMPTEHVLLLNPQSAKNMVEVIQQELDLWEKK